MGGSGHRQTLASLGLVARDTFASVEEAETGQSAIVLPSGAAKGAMDSAAPLGAGRGVGAGPGP